MPGSELVQSVQRAVEILRALAHGDADGLALKDIAAGAKMRPTTTHNLLRTLAACDLVENTGGLYRLGGGIIDLAARRLAQRRGRIARTVVSRFTHDHSPVTVLYSQPIGPHVVVSLRTSPDQPGILQTPVGHILNPYTTVSGLVVQAYADNERLRAIHGRHSFWEEGAALWGETAKLDTYLEEVRRLGYAVAPFDSEHTLRIAAPVFDAGHSFAAVFGIHLALGNASNRRSRKDILRATLDAANAIFLQEETT